MIRHLRTQSLVSAVYRSALVSRNLPWPEKFLVVRLLLGILFCKRLHLNCLIMFWILDIVLSRWLLINLYSDLMLCPVSEIFRILVYSELCLFKYMQGYSSIFSIIKAYIEASLRHIQVYSGIFSSLSNPPIFTS